MNVGCVERCFGIQVRLTKRALEVRQCSKALEKCTLKCSYIHTFPPSVPAKVYPSWGCNWCAHAKSDHQIITAQLVKEMQLDVSVSLV